MMELTKLKPEQIKPLATVFLKQLPTIDPEAVINQAALVRAVLIMEVRGLQAGDSIAGIRAAISTYAASLPPEQGSWLTALTKDSPLTRAQQIVSAGESLVSRGYSVWLLPKVDIQAPGVSGTPVSLLDWPRSSP
jgi:hypothetical protein